jgi:hypothetical protein
MLTTESIKLEINVPMEMRDGTILYADTLAHQDDVYWQQLGGRLPLGKVPNIGVQYNVNVNNEGNARLYGIRARE